MIPWHSPEWFLVVFGCVFMLISGYQSEIILYKTDICDLITCEFIISVPDVQSNYIKYHWTVVNNRVVG